MNKLIATSTILFFGVIFLAGCTADQQKLEEVKQDMIEKKDVAEENIQKVLPEEIIDFEHPGNDEVGKKVEQIDSLINSTSASGYEDDLSGDVLAEQE